MQSLKPADIYVELEYATKSRHHITQYIYHHHYRKSESWCSSADQQMQLGRNVNSRNKKNKEHIYLPKGHGAHACLVRYEDQFTGIHHKIFTSNSLGKVSTVHKCTRTIQNVHQEKHQKYT